MSIRNKRNPKAPTLEPSPELAAALQGVEAEAAVRAARSETLELSPAELTRIKAAEEPSPELSAAVEHAAASIEASALQLSAMERDMMVEPPATVFTTVEPSYAAAESERVEREIRRHQRQDADAARRREKEAAAARRKEVEAAARATIKHRWLARLRNDLQQMHSTHDGEAAMADYGPPDWSLWTEYGSWDVAKDAIPLILGHNPDRVDRAPYLNVAWCANNLDRPEVKTVRLVVDAMGTAFGRARTIPNTMNPGYLTILGYSTTPLEFVAWAASRGPIVVPPPLRQWLEARRPAASAVQPATTPAVQPATTEGRSFPKLPSTDRRRREGFTTMVAMRFAGVEVRGKPGAALLGFDREDTTISGYLADSQLWGKAWKELEAWADGPGDWAAVFERLRRWVPEAEK
jgi:hypothetical protein